jgi:hypothetical protein
MAARFTVFLDPDLCWIAVVASQMVTGQQTRNPSAGAPTFPVSGWATPANWTPQQDHRNMMDQLGIGALRPGPSGNEKPLITPTTMSRRLIRFRICPMRSP